MALAEQQQVWAMEPRGARTFSLSVPREATQGVPLGTAPRRSTHRTVVNKNPTGQPTSSTRVDHYKMLFGKVWTLFQWSS